jgi:hypothetical protein
LHILNSYIYKDLKIFSVMTVKAGISILTLLVILLATSLQSCVNNNEEDLYGIEQCDTTNVTWASKIAGIMEKRCVACHGPEVAYKGVRHDTYEYEMIVVNDGRLRGVVNHLPGYSKMPKDSEKLPECELKLINIWLDNGAPEF